MQRHRDTLPRWLCAGLVLLACALSLLLGWRFGSRLDDVYGRLVARWSGTPFVPASAQRYFQTTLGMHLRMDAQIPAGAVVFLGDSITQGLAVTAVAPLAVNLGIGQQTTSLMLLALPHYQSLRRSAAVVLTIGVNDVLQGQPDGLAQRLRQIDRALPSDRPLLWNAIMPLRGAGAGQANGQLAAANAVARELCAARPACRFLDTWGLFIGPDGQVQDAWLLEDGIHLSAAGYRRWVSAMQPALQALLNPTHDAPPKN